MSIPSAPSGGLTLAGAPVLPHRMAAGFQDATPNLQAQEAFACITLANAPPARVRHKAKPRVSVGGGDPGSECWGTCDSVWPTEVTAGPAWSTPGRTPEVVGQLSLQQHQVCPLWSPGAHLWVCTVSVSSPLQPSQGSLGEKGCNSKHPEERS